MLENHLMIFVAMWPQHKCHWNCIGLPVTSYLSMTVVGSHIPESIVVHAWLAMALLFPTHNTELEITCTSVVNRFPQIEMNVSQDYAFQFCLDEIQWHSSATFVRSSSLVRTVSIILTVS